MVVQAHLLLLLRVAVVAVAIRAESILQRPGGLVVAVVRTVQHRSVRTALRVRGTRGAITARRHRSLVVAVVALGEPEVMAREVPVVTAVSAFRLRLPGQPPSMPAAAPAEAMALGPVVLAVLVEVATAATRSPAPLEPTGAAAGVETVPTAAMASSSSATQRDRGAPCLTSS